MTFKQGRFFFFNISVLKLEEIRVKSKLNYSMLDFYFFFNKLNYIYLIIIMPIRLFWNSRGTVKVRKKKPTIIIATLKPSLVKQVLLHTQQHSKTPTSGSHLNTARQVQDLQLSDKSANSSLLNHLESSLEAAQVTRGNHQLLQRSLSKEIHSSSSQTGTSTCTHKHWPLIGILLQLLPCSGAL